MIGNNAQVIPALHYTPLDGIDGLHVDFRVDIRGLFVEFGEGPVDPTLRVGGGLVEDGDDQGAGEALVQFVHLVLEILHGRHHFLGAGVDLFALTGQGETARPRRQRVTPRRISRSLIWREMVDCG